MKKYGLLLFIFTVIFCLNCASTTTAPDVKKDTDTKSGFISSQNKQLVNHPVTGFAYKSAKLNTANWNKWAESAAPIVKEIVAKLPDGYALQVTGHTDASGPAISEASKPGNLKISADRAKTVFDALKKAGISSPKIIYKGAGSDELMNVYAPRSAEQRRVTFKIVEL